MKVAVLLTGFVRSLQNRYPDFKKYLLDKYDCELFIQTWDIKNIDRLDICVSQNKVTQQDVRKLLPNWTQANIRVEDWNLYDQNRKDFKFIERDDDVFKKDERAARHGKQFVRKIEDIHFLIKKGKEQILDFEQENEVKFDVIVKFRTDLILDKEMDLLLDDVVYTSGFAEKDVSDWFAYGNRDNMLHYLSIFDFLNKMYEENIDVSYGERVLYHHLHSKNINVKSYQENKWEIDRSYDKEENLGKKIVFNQNHWGSFFLHEHDPIRERFPQYVFWDQYLKQVFDQFLHKKSVVLEVGSGNGFYTVYLAKRSGFVFAFEHRRFLINQLGSNLFLNNCWNVKTFEIACHNDHGLQNLEDYTYDQSRIYTANIGEYESLCNYQNTTIDSLKFSQVNFLKINTINLEYEVLKGAEETIRQYRPIIVFSSKSILSQKEIVIFKNILNLLENDHGYSVKKIRAVKRVRDEDQEVFVSDDFIAFPKEICK